MRSAVVPINARQLRVALPERPEINYLRKSSEGDDKQALSIDQQLTEINAKFGELPEYFPGTALPTAYADSKSGKTFEARVGFMAMLAFCEANPQPEDAPGRIRMWRGNRFGRAVNRQGKKDLKAMKRMAWRFEDAGWELTYCNRQRSGNMVVDEILDTVDYDAASDYAVKLGEDVRRGKKRWATEGYWVFGRCPFPTARQEAFSGRVLEPGRYSTEPVVLVRDPGKYAAWEHGARMLCKGAGPLAVADWFQANVPSPRVGGRWWGTDITYIYTNTALVGEREILFGGECTKVEFLWRADPPVPANLFWQAYQAIKSSPSKPRSGTNHLYPLTRITCALCGGQYYGNTLRGKRTYRHGTRFVMGDAGVIAAMLEHGCKNWTVDGSDLEERVKQLILKERCGPEAIEALQALLNGPGAAESEAQVRFHAAEARHAEALRGLNNLLEVIKHAAGDPETLKLLFTQVADQRRVVEDAQRDAKFCLETYRLSNTVTGDAFQSLNEMQIILDGWATASDLERRTVFDWWVDDITILVDHPKGIRNARSKEAFVTLSSSLDTRHITMPTYADQRAKVVARRKESSQRIIGAGADTFRVRLATYQDLRRHSALRA